MSNPNQPSSNPQMKLGIDPSKMQMPFNPQSLTSLGGGQFLPTMTNLTSAFGGGGIPQESYSHFLPGEVTQGELMKKLKEKFGELKEEVEKMEKNPEKFKTHQLPLARIKKIMKSDEDVRMISAEAPVLFAKACELFIVELTHRAWIHTEEGKRRTLQKNDIAQCIANTDIFDFLIDIIPREEYAKTAMMKKSTMLGAFSNQLPYSLPPNMGNLAFPSQMMGNNMMNPNGGGGPNQPGGNKPQENPGNYLPQNMMFMQNMGMMGNIGKSMPQPKHDE